MATIFTYKIASLQSGNVHGKPKFHKLILLNNNFIIFLPLLHKTSKQKIANTSKHVFKRISTTKELPKEFKWVSEAERWSSKSSAVT